MAARWFFSNDKAMNSMKTFLSVNSSAVTLLEKLQWAKRSQRHPTLPLWALHLQPHPFRAESCPSQFRCFWRRNPVSRYGFCVLGTLELLRCNNPSEFLKPGCGWEWFSHKTNRGREREGKWSENFGIRFSFFLFYLFIFSAFSLVMPI